MIGFCCCGVWFDLPLLVLGICDYNCAFVSNRVQIFEFQSVLLVCCWQVLLLCCLIWSALCRSRNIWLQLCYNIKYSSDFRLSIFFFEGTILDFQFVVCKCTVDRVFLLSCLICSAPVSCRNVWLQLCYNFKQSQHFGLLIWKFTTIQHVLN